MASRWSLSGSSQSLGTEKTPLAAPFSFGLKGGGALVGPRQSRLGTIPIQLTEG
jgi:hypothetical protein